MSPCGHINVHIVCSPWVKSRGMASYNLIPSGTEHRKWCHFGRPTRSRCVSTFKRTGVIPAFFWDAEEMMRPSHPAASSVFCLQGSNATVQEAFSLLHFPSHPFPKHGANSFIFVSQQHPLLAALRIAHRAIMLPSAFLQGRAATSLGCAGSSADTSQFYSFRSETHFIWNWSKPLIQNYTGGLSVTQPCNRDPVLKWEPKQVNTERVLFF